MKLQYNSICIRNAEKTDCKQLAKWWNDGAVMAHAGFPNGLNTNEMEIEQQIATDRDDFRRRLIIEAGNEPIGEMIYYIQDDHTAELGIKICKPVYQNKGLGRIILSMLIEELFRRGYTRIILDTNLNNKRAQHVYEKLGFMKVRVRENDWKNQLGELQSSVEYELTPEHFVQYR